MPLFSQAPPYTRSSEEYSLFPLLVEAFFRSIMRLFIVTLFITLYVFIVSATPGKMGFSIGVVVYSSFDARVLTKNFVEVNE